MSANVLFEELNGSFLEEKGVQLIIKREDLFFPEIPGNKWRKLKYNIEQAKKGGFSSILSFGGAYSNHIAALATAGKLFDISSIGIIRGQEIRNLNSTLAKASTDGMQLKFVDRELYRTYTQEQKWESLITEFPNSYIIPEGGTNMLAIKGCAEIIADIDIPYDYLCCPVGTGGTITGILTAVPSNKQIIAFPALKGEFLKKEIDKLSLEFANRVFTNYIYEVNYHFGGYAKFDAALIDFILSFYKEYGIALDPIYTGKMMFGIFEKIKQGFFKRGSQIIAIHTGGLQGIPGFNERHGTELPLS